MVRTFLGEAERNGRVFESVSLENDFLIVEVIPELGASLTRVRDRRLGVEVLGEGLDFSVTGAAHHDSVLYRLGEDHLWLYGSVPGVPISYHLRLSLADGQSVLEVHARVFNRSLESSAIDPGWATPAEAVAVGPFVAAAGLGFSAPEEALFARQNGVCRYDGATALAGRVTEAFTAVIVPLSGLDEVLSVSSSVAIGFSEDCLVVSSFAALTGCDLILLDAGGRTMATKADLRPEIPLRFPFGEIGGKPQGLVIRDSSGADLAAYGVETDAATPALKAGVVLDSVEAMESRALAGYQHLVEYRHLVAARRTIDAFRASDFAEAALRAEQELLFNGDDPLAWIEKAVASRLAGGDPDDSDDLANAHFLAPLEPLLRAEAFMGATEDASALLAPLRGHQAAILDVAAFYLERGLFSDAGRWLNELADFPLGLYLLADRYLSSEMKVQALEIVVRAEACEKDGLLPYRLEQEALARLVEAFPDYARLARFAGPGAS